jgi:hypothetical protein
MGSLKTWLGFGGLGLIVALAGTSSGCGNDGGSSNRDAATAAVCGNGVVEGDEDCDEGAANNIDGSGCDSDCTFSCTVDADCDDGSSCNGFETCNTTLHRCQMGTPLADGTACTLMLPAPPDGDGGVPDGGVPDGGGEPELVETPSVCLSAQCARPCEGDEECNDGNPCNGEETCNLEYGACQPGEDLECDDGLECTTNACDAEENPETGCVFTLIDEDGDGFASEHLDCDDRGGDCDDTNPDIHPAADRICGDGIDNNCLGTTADVLPIWYQDCDGDGYAAASAISAENCTKPATTEQCLDWTQRTPSGLSHTDCDDTNAAVYPGARNSTNGGWYLKPHCRGTGQLASGSAGSFSCSTGTLSWDYDCDGVWSKRYTNVNYSDSSSCEWSGWIAISLDGDGEGDASESLGDVHKSTLWSAPEETGTVIICYDCTNTVYCHTGAGYTASWSPSCGYEAEYRQCSGNSACPCLSTTRYCTSALSQKMQECR